MDYTIRKLTPLEKRIKQKYTRIVGFVRNEWCAEVKIDHQSFRIVESTSKRRANWFCVNAAIALARMLENESKP